MIGSLRGSVLERLDDGRVLVEVSGVGYLVTVTPRTLAELEPTSPVFLYVHHHIREDSQTLFGFLRRDERAAFDVLIATRDRSGARGRDPRYLSRRRWSTSSQAMISARMLVPGVGKKTAERLLIELRNRLNLPMLDPCSGIRHHRRRQRARHCPASAMAPRRFAKRCDLPESASAEELLRDALRLLGVRRA
jgi:Holliday junction DNA helicase RuvA